MFEECLLDSVVNRSNLRKGGPWPTLLSFTIELTLLGLLVLLPLAFTEALPPLHLRDYVSAPAPTTTPEPVQVFAAQPHAQPRGNETGLQAPLSIPPRILRVNDAELLPSAVAPSLPIGTGVPHSTGSGPNPFVSDIIRTPQPALPHAAEPPRVNASEGVTAGLLIRRIQPKYPYLAQQTRTSGEVLLQAVIGKDGTIRNLTVISGHPLLIQSAIDAVRQWKYKPYLLNGEPVEVDTQVTVRFTLAGG